MKSKKAILEWWENLSYKPEDFNHLEDFKSNIDKSINVEYRQQNAYGTSFYKLTSDKWKIPMWLAFSQDNICVRINF